MKSDLSSHVLVNCQSSNSIDDMEDEDDSDTSSPPLPYLQGPPPDGCCTVDGRVLNRRFTAYIPASEVI